MKRFFTKIVKSLRWAASIRSHFFWFLFTVTIALQGCLCHEFLTKGRREVNAEYAQFYMMLLLTYISFKEGQRWYEQHVSVKLGELMVISWGLLALAMVLINWYDPSYKLPEQLQAIVGAVFGGIVVSGTSKARYQHIREKDKGEEREEKTKRNE